MYLIVFILPILVGHYGASVQFSGRLPPIPQTRGQMAFPKIKPLQPKRNSNKAAKKSDQG